MSNNHSEVKDWQKRAGILTEADDLTDIKREEYLNSKFEEIIPAIEAIGKEVNLLPLVVVEMLREYLKNKSRTVTVRSLSDFDENVSTPEKKHGLSELSIEEKEQLKDYANAIKETKKAMMELINKSSKKIKTEDGRWGGPRKDMFLDPNK